MVRTLAIRASVVIAAGAVLAVPLALGCRPTTPQGVIETYSVRGTLDDNGCAPGLPAVDPIAFEVQLRRNGPSLTWRIMPDGPPVPGTLAPDGTFRFESELTVQAWAPMPANGIAGCTLRQIETVTGRFETADAGVASDAGARSDAGTESSGLSGTERVRVTLAAGSDCARLLVVNGGSFPALPCEAHYTLAGARQ